MPRAAARYELGGMVVVRLGIPSGSGGGWVPRVPVAMLADEVDPPSTDGGPPVPEPRFPRRCDLLIVNQQSLSGWN